MCVTDDSANRRMTGGCTFSGSRDEQQECTRAPLPPTQGRFNRANTALWWLHWANHRGPWGLLAQPPPQACIYILARRQGLILQAC